MNNIRATLTDFICAGAFGLPKKLSDGKFRSSRGGIGKKDAGHLYVKGTTDADTMGVSVFSIPELSKGLFDELPVTTASPFIDIEGQVDKHGQKNNRMTSMIEYNGYLIGGMIHNYEAGADDTHFLWRYNGLVVEGLYANEGDYRAMGWITPIPLEWQEALGSTHIMGGGHNYSISGRASIGPSAFGVDLNQVTADVVVEPIKATAFMDYDRAKDHALFKTKYPEITAHHGLDNLRCNIEQVDDPAIPGPNRVSYGDPLLGPTLGNDIWISNTRSGIGFIIPGTCTYAVIGTMYGLESGAAYRIRDDQGVQYNGPHSYVQDDWTHMVWLFDVNDFLEVKAGTKKPYDMLPYEYHPIDIPLITPTGNDGPSGARRADIKNGCAIGNRIYLSLTGGDSSQPVIVAFDAAVGGVIEPPVLPPIIEPPVIDPVIDLVAKATQAAHDAIDNLVTELTK